MEKLRETVIAKVPFGIFRSTIGNFFNQNNVDYMGRDYESTFRKVDRLLMSGSFDLNQFNNMLEDFLLRYLIFGKKIVYSFRIGEQNLYDILESIKHSNDYHSLEEEDGMDALGIWNKTALRQKGKNKRYFMSSFEHSNFFVTFWGGKRIENFREQIHPEDLGERYKKYSDIYGITEIIYQSYDMVILDFSKGTIDLLIDNSSTKKISNKMRYEYRTHLLQSFCEEYNIDSALFRYTEKNYFPSIKQFYESKDVNVRNYGFKTDDGLYSDSALKNRSHDLRANRFHKGGSDVIKNKLSGYSIVLEHLVPTSNNHILQVIPGTGRLMDVTNPKIDNYEFYGVFSFGEYQYLKDTMTT